MVKYTYNINLKGENMKKIVLFLIIILSTTLWADYYVKQVTYTTAGNNKSQSKQYSETWLGDNVIATIVSATSTIINGKQKTFTMLIHKNKTYIQGKLPFNMLKFLPEAYVALTKQMLSSMTIKVKKTNEKKKILKYNCSAYAIEMSVGGMKMNIKMWVSKEVPFDYKKYKSLTEEQLKATMNLNNPSKINEIKKIDGFPLATETNSLGQNSINKTVELKKCSPPKGIYSIPKGYKKVDKLSSFLNK